MALKCIYLRIRSHLKKLNDTHIKHKEKTTYIFFSQEISTNAQTLSRFLEILNEVPFNSRK